MKSFKSWLPVTVVLCGLQNIVNGYFEIEYTTPMSEQEMETRLQEKSTNVIDKILEAYKVAIIASGNSQGEIILDNIEKEFTISFLKASFSARDGRLTNVLTVQRTSPVNVTRDEDTEVITIKSSVGFEYLKIAFERFLIDMPLKKNLEAKIEAEIKNCIFEVTIEVKLESPCSAKLTDVQIIEFSNFTPAVNGLRWKLLDTIASKIVNAFIEEFSKSGRLYVQNYFYENIKEAIELANVCSIINE